MFGYDFGMKVFTVLDDGQEHHIARLDYGGGYHGMRARFDLSGTGCSLVKSWLSIQNYIMSNIAPVLTRVDLAADFKDGEFSVDDCVNWYQSGLFNAGGRNPRHSMVGDWLNPVYGRTFEVGRRENGKMLRAYEKGRQLGDPASLWTRFEVELRNKDREIPFNILTDADSFFTGAYKCLEEIVDAISCRIETDQNAAKISIEKLITHAKASYGRLFNVLGMFLSTDQIFEQLTRLGVPARLEKASLQGFLKNGSAAVPLKE
jgi:phage replication initiation protein